LHFFECRDQVALSFAFGFRGVADVAGEINGFADARLAGRDVALEFREELAGDVAFGQKRGVVRFGWPLWQRGQPCPRRPGVSG